MLNKIELNKTRVILLVICLAAFIAFTSKVYASVRNNSFPGGQLIVLDMTGETGVLDYTLPAITGATDGDTYFIKVIHGVEFGGRVFPAAGDTFDEGEDNIEYLEIYPSGHYSYTLVADNDLDTWYIISKGQI